MRRPRILSCQDGLGYIYLDFLLPYVGNGGLPHYERGKPTEQISDVIVRMSNDTELPEGYHGYIDPNFPNPGTDGDSVIIVRHLGFFTPHSADRFKQIYGYTPALALGILGVVLFAMSLALHFQQMLRYRNFYFGIPMCIGALFEIVGYVMRILSAKVSPYRVSFFVVQYFFIVVAPVFFSASIYAVLSALIRHLGSWSSPIVGPKAILATFVTSDVICTIIQIVGAALIGVSESNRRDPTVANNILLAGLAAQVFSFLIFLILLFVFFWKVRSWLGDNNSPPSREKRSAAPVVGVRWYAAGFLAATILIYLRTTFRLSETAKGLFSDLQTREVFFGCLEFMPVVLAVGILSLVHPGRWVDKQR